MHRNAGPLVSSFPAIELHANIRRWEGNVARVMSIITNQKIIPLIFFSRERSIRFEIFRIDLVLFFDKNKFREKCIPLRSRPKKIETIFIR